MEQHAVPRFAADQAVWVTLLGKLKTRIRGRIRNGRGIGIEVDRRFLWERREHALYGLADLAKALQDSLLRAFK